MRTLSRQCLSVAISCLLGMPMGSSAAGDFRGMQGMPAGYFNEIDLGLLRDAVVGVLEEAQADATRSWSNSKNGHSGKVTSLRAFQTSDGRPCKTVRIDNSAEGYRSSMKYDVCLAPDRQWREAEFGLPFGKATDAKGSP